MCVCVSSYLCIVVCVSWDLGMGLCVCACVCAFIGNVCACVQVKWSILMWGFKSAGGVEERRKQKSQWMEERIKGGRERVRVGS